eukprot:GHVU01045189.1.p1 GENE.GHVU01045189.1~~GHVU01045189.1.p1  ORF type:complete len:153 (+),score=13.56 GHVU01045189.1:355-813(+)
MEKFGACERSRRVGGLERGSTEEPRDEKRRRSRSLRRDSSSSYEEEYLARKERASWREGDVAWAASPLPAMQRPPTDSRDNRQRKRRKVTSEDGEWSVDKWSKDVAVSGGRTREPERRGSLGRDKRESPGRDRQDRRDSSRWDKHGKQDRRY